MKNLFNNFKNHLNNENKMAIISGCVCIIGAFMTLFGNGVQMDSGVGIFMASFVVMMLSINNETEEVEEIIVEQEFSR